jgi:hypothetical protein
VTDDIALRQKQNKQNDEEDTRHSSNKKANTTLWGSKDKLRKVDVVVTDDIALKQKQQNKHNEEEDMRHSTNKKANTTSPKKKQKSKASPEKALFGDVDYFKKLFNI